MSITYVILIAIVICLAMVMLRARGASSQSTHDDSAASKGGTSKGDLQSYFDKMTELDQSGHDEYFVTVVEDGGDKFVQVSAGTPPGGSWGDQFDLPIVDWSRGYVSRIAAEAERLGFHPIQSDGGPMEFLDINFTNRTDHDAFARWVMTQVFELPEMGRYQITWG